MESVPTTVSVRMSRRSVLLIMCLAVAVAACGAATVSTEVPGGQVVQAAAPTDTAAPSIPSEPPVVTVDAVDGGEPADEQPETTFGTGLTDDELVEATAELVAAEAWLAELETEWDNGMTYSEIFRAWRSVSAETGPALAAFEVPAAADRDQAAALASLAGSVQGAHDEWQATVDFIVTYITNYTPEILITKAYQAVEVHLRDSAAVRTELGIPPAPRPEIVIEELADL